jgi:DnaJ-domain-containing protein 1
VKETRGVNRLEREVKMASGKLEGPSAPALRRDPYEVLCVTRDSSDQEIKSAYRKLALKYLFVSLSRTHAHARA